jgi:PAS domain S-box-containing protein
LNKVRLGIVAKGLILVAIPLVFECAFVGAMANLEVKSEAAANAAERDREISDLINELIAQLYAELQTVRLNLLEFAPGSAHKTRLREAKEKIGRLMELIGKDNLQDQNTLKAVSLAIDEGNTIIMRAENALRSGDEAEQLRIRIEARHFPQRIITPELLALGEKRSAISATEPSVQAEFRQRTRIQLCIALLLSILGTVALAIFTTRLVTRRLASLAENSRLIAQGQKLREPVPGGDEIAELDLNLHKAAQEIDELLLRERVIFQNARDIICVIDRDLNILRISPSAQSVLGIPPQELIGTSCIELFARNASQEAIAKIANLAQNCGSTAPLSAIFEGCLKTKLKALNVRISLSVVPKEDNLILIFHDVTSIRQAERLKQDVVSMVSHDLRSPLSMVGHALEMFAAGRFGEINGDGKKMLSMARQSTTQMAVLITDLLDLDRIESGVLRLSLTTISSQQILEWAQTLTSDQAGLSGCPVKVASAAGLVSCDPDRVNQILINLIGNALKFSPAGAEVTIQAQVKSPLVQFSVRDQGSGIPLAKLEKIFERFEQARESDQDTGTGLGLTICKALVELHGGSIWVENNSGAGSTFHFTLPEARRQFGPAVTRT